MKSSGEKVGRLTFLQTRLQTWREEELKRWKVVPAEMSDEEIEKEVEASVERLEEEFNKAIKKYAGTREDIWEELEHRELRRGASERLRRLLIGEDLKGMSKQLDEVFEKNAAKADRIATTSYENYQAMLKSTLAKKNKAVGNFKSFAELQKLQFHTTIQSGEMQYASLLRTEETLRSIAHSNLKSYLMSISVLREMKKNLEEVRENTDRKQQFKLVVAASIVAGIVVGFFVDSALLVFRDEIESNPVLLVPVGVVLVLLVGWVMKKIR